MRSNDEHDKTYFRRSRFFSVNCQWYFHTREGYDLGPFDSFAAAQETLARFLKPKIEEKIHSDAYVHQTQFSPEKKIAF